MQGEEHSRGRDKPRESARESGGLWSIHYLRAIAALGVVLFHSLDGTNWQFNLGAAGIHLFFTISGFVIWTSTERRPVAVAPFMAARIVRIVPLYWLATLVAVLSTFVVPGYFWQATTRPINLVTSLLFIPHEGVSGGVYPVLYQGWTLQYEMYFYALFAACLIVPARRRLLALAVCLGVALAAGAIFKPDGPILQTYTHPICLEFLAGVVAARIVDAAGKRLGRGGAALLAAAGGIAFLLADTCEDRLGWWANVLLPLGTASVVVGLVCLERAGGLVRSTWLRFAGEASYSTYLFQTVGFALVASLMPHLPALARVLLFVVAAQTCGCLMFRFVEKPLVRTLKAHTLQRSGDRRVSGAARAEPIP
ncbi:acyltransferase [Novosphingobium sp. KCTC 2891]|uniref:acyltransferase family protein n=1 Tax=Novosphingobium sp. KCTC 2891 TaxID=2989730 RepID=UPI002222CB0E|nr:acyltransferase [Novosphingobium sp. KCTC 2891]MCW1381929.1 acyltransferase [Novosphingobium sp. KCTC 2891]